MFLPMWAMVYFRALPVPLRELDHDLLEIFFNFANTYTEESVLKGYAKKRLEFGTAPAAEKLRGLGYSDEDIAGMDL
jgi:hypothetical protein